MPFTDGPIDMDFDGTTMTVNSLPWGGVFNGADYFMPPDEGTLNVLFVTDNGEGTFDYKIGWESTVTTYNAFNTHWRLEGVGTVVPLPAAAWLLASGRAAAARRRNKPRD